MFIKIIWRNLIGHPLRTALTAVAAAMCVVAFLLLRTVSVGWVTASTKKPNDLYVRHALSILARFPIRTVDKVKRMPFVAHASPFLVFPTESPTAGVDNNGGGAVDPVEFLAIRTQTSISASAEDQERWIKTRDGVLVGNKIAAREHWTVGEVVSLRSPPIPLPGGEPWKFTIAGIYTPTSSGDDGELLYAHYDYINAAVDPSMRDLTNGIVLSVNPGYPVANAPKEIDAALAEDVPTITTDVVSAGRSLSGMFGAFFLILDSLSTIFVGIVLLLLVNTIALGVRERTSHYAVMRALGFRGGSIAALIAGEAAALAVLGTGLGCLLSDLLINRVVGPAVEASVTAIPSVHLQGATIALTILCAAPLGALAAMPAFTTVIRRRLTDALRFVG